MAHRLMEKEKKTVLDRRFFPLYTCIQRILKNFM